MEDPLETKPWSRPKADPEMEGGRLWSSLLQSLLLPWPAGVGSCTAPETSSI